VSIVIWLGMAVAGGIGAACRLLVDGIVRNKIRIAYPLGTLIINVSGSLLLGFVAGLALSQLVSDDWKTILGTGLLGGYTTFSTASLETVRLIQERRYSAALTNGVGMLVLSVAAAYLGLWLGGLL
jgi:CrcB protein